MNFLQLSLLAFVIHLANSLAILITALTADKTLKLPLTLTRFGGPPGSFELDEVKVLWNVPLWILVFAFSTLAAIDHALAILITIKGGSDGTKPGSWVAQAQDWIISLVTWTEYKFSATIMMVTILLLSGVTDLFTILLVCVAFYASFHLTVISDKDIFESLFYDIGIVQLRNPSDIANRKRMFWVGSLLMLMPWVIVFSSLFMANPPGFVYAIVFSLFLLFCPFAVVQYRFISQPTEWAATKMHARNCQLVWRSILAKTALVWQIYANALVL